KSRSADVIALDDALTVLARIDEQQSRIVELRFFGGLTTAAHAQVLGISPATGKRDWSVAKAWLSRQMRRGQLCNVLVAGRRLKKLSVPLSSAMPPTALPILMKPVPRTPLCALKSSPSSPPTINPEITSLSLPWPARCFPQPHPSSPLALTACSKFLVKVAWVRSGLPNRPF